MKTKRTQARVSLRILKQRSSTWETSKTFSTKNLEIWPPNASRSSQIPSKPKKKAMTRLWRQKSRLMLYQPNFNNSRMTRQVQAKVSYSKSWAMSKLLEVWELKSYSLGIKSTTNLVQHLSPHQRFSRFLKASTDLLPTSQTTISMTVCLSKSMSVVRRSKRSNYACLTWVSRSLTIRT